MMKDIDFVGARRWFGCLVALVAFAGVSPRAQAAPACEELFRPQFTAESLNEWARLREDIQNSEGALRAALESEWQTRIASLSPSQRNSVVEALRLQPRGKMAENKIEALKKDQRESMRSFPKTTRIVDFAKPLDSRDLDRLRNGESSFYGTSGARRQNAGWQWGTDRQFVAVRSHGDADVTEVVDLVNSTVLRLPGSGVLTQEGGKFLEHSGKNQTLVHDLRKRVSIAQLEGTPMYGVEFLRDDFVITNIPQQNQFMSSFMLHDLRGGSVRSIALGAQFAVGEDFKHVAFVQRGELVILDLGTGQKVPHQFSGRQISLGSSNDNLGAFEFTVNRSRYVLYLSDLSIHNLDKLDSKSMLLRESHFYYQSDSAVPTKYTVTSPQTGQSVAVPGNSSVHTRLGSDLWLYVPREWKSQSGELFQLDNLTGAIRHQSLSGGYSKFMASGYLIGEQNGALSLFDLRTQSQLQIPGASIRDVMGMSPQDGLLFLAPDKERPFVRSFSLVTGQTVDMNTQFLSFSPDGNWILIESQGQLQLHRVER